MRSPITVIFTGLLTVLLLACSLPVACTSSPQGKSRPLPALEAQGMLRNDFAVLIDAREASPAGSSRVRIKNAIELPLSLLMQDSAEGTARVQKLPKGKTLAVIAETAEQSKIASERLAKLGFQAGHLGTLEEWKQAGGATE